MKHQAGCEVCAVLPLNSPIFETNHWMVSLSPDQGYLGRCYVTLKQHKGDMAELTNEEWLEFADIVKKLEGAITKAFGARMFNWGCLMNNAFQSEVALPHVHWHVRPRYDAPVVFSGEEFSDAAFGHHYDREQSKKLNAEMMDSIRREVQAYL